MSFSYNLQLQSESNVYYSYETYPCPVHIGDSIKTDDGLLRVVDIHHENESPSLLILENPL